jgi:hypothetical protein
MRYTIEYNAVAGNVCEVAETLAPTIHVRLSYGRRSHGSSSDQALLDFVCGGVAMEAEE